ncbi:MAG: hypothetical protein AAGI01_07935 [Myxococcota bacterium]
MPTIQGRMALDTSARPLVRMEMAGSISDDELDYFLRVATKGLMSDDDAFVLLLVVDRPERTTKQQNDKLMAWFQRHEQTILARCLGVAFVVPHLIHRTMGRAMLAARPPRVAHVLVSQERDGAQWCAEKLSSAGMAA